MTPSALPLNALRAFEASARHLSFTRAADELCVTQGAVSHQVRALEARLGCSLFRRLPRGLALTEEAEALLPALSDSFARMAELMDQVQGGLIRAPLVLGVVATFAAGWLLPRLAAFQEAHPFVDLRLRTHNNKVDLGGERLDAAIQFGDGAWAYAEAVKILDAPLAPLCTPALARDLAAPADLARHTLLRSFRADEWPRWFAAAGAVAPTRVRGPMFDSSLAMIAAAELGVGVALAPPAMFRRELSARRLVQPFADAVDLGAYYLTRPRAKPPSDAYLAFRDWCLAEAGAPAPAAAMAEA